MTRSIPTAIVVMACILVGQTSSAEVVSYVFDSGNSTLEEYYGATGVTYTAHIGGTFILKVDTGAGTAWFDHVNATLSVPISYWDYDLEEFLDTQDLDTQFCLSELVSTSVSDTEINFVLERNQPMFPDADVDLDVFISGDSIQLIGGFGVPFFDGPVYEMNAVAAVSDVPSISSGGLAVLAGLFTGTAWWLVRRRCVASA